MHRLSRLLLALTLVASSRCAFDTAVPTGIKVACEVSADCPPGLVCVPETQRYLPPDQLSGAACGDEIVSRAGTEECDEGASNSDTEPGACRTTCVKARCGDSVVEPGEQCDDAAGGSARRAENNRRAVMSPLYAEPIPRARLSSSMAGDSHPATATSSGVAPAKPCLQQSASLNRTPGDAKRDGIRIGFSYRLDLRARTTPRRPRLFSASSTPRALPS